MITMKVDEAIRRKVGCSRDIFAERFSQFDKRVGSRGEQVGGTTIKKMYDCNLRKNVMVPSLLIQKSPQN